jgi:LysR family transcriptional regulator, glycine cleavage system transcriptional activator
MPVAAESRSPTSPSQKSLPPFAQLRAFEAVGRLGGMRRAAQALGLNHAVVSRHLRSLEDWAGAQLIDRARGNPVLTAAGARFHARITAAIGDLQQASAELVGRNEAGVLKIWCVPGLASEWLTSRLELFHAAHPELELELRPTDASPDFSRYEADVDIRYINGHAPISAMRIAGGVRRFEISRPAVLAVASPACAAALGRFVKPAGLLAAPLLHEESSAQWREWLQAHGVAVETELHGLRLWHAHLTLDAARRGRGVALANGLLLGDDLETGRLVSVLAPSYHQSEIALGAYAFAARADRWHSAAVSAFRRWLKNAVPPSLSVGPPAVPLQPRATVAA